MEHTNQTTQTLWIDGPLPGLNELNNQQRTPVARKYNQTKAGWEWAVAAAVAQSKLRPVVGLSTITFAWYEPNRRRDPDNISAGGRKLILDGLRKIGILPGDGWKHIAGFGAEIFVVRPEKPGVLVTITTLPVPVAE